MTTFTSVASWTDLLEQVTPRSYGVALSPVDSFGLLFSVQLAVRNTQQGVWDSFSSEVGWDAASWDDTDFVTWADITSRVRGLQWDRGATDPLTQPEVGTATITLDNRDGEVSPWATTGPYTNPVDGTISWDSDGWDVTAAGSGASLIRPGTVVRFGVTLSDGAWFPFFTGTIETITEGAYENADGWVDVGLVEFGAQLAAIGTGNGTLTDGHDGKTMLADLLADIAWPYVSLITADVTPTLMTSAPQNAPDNTMNRLQAAQLLATGGFCKLLTGADGRFVLVPENTAAIGSLTLSNSPTGTELPIAVDAVTPYSSTDRLLNVVSGAGVTGTLQTVTDPFSVDQFGVLANALGWPRTGLLLQNDSDVLVLLNDVLNEQSQDYLGISAVQVDCDLDRVNWYFQLAVLATGGLNVNSGFTVRWIHPSGNQLLVTVRLIGFNHSITMEGSQAKWTATLRTVKV